MLVLTKHDKTGADILGRSSGLVGVIRSIGTSLQWFIPFASLKDCGLWPKFSNVSADAFWHVTNRLITSQMPPYTTTWLSLPQIIRYDTKHSRALGGEP